MPEKRSLLWFLILMALYAVTRIARDYVRDIPIFFRYHFTDLLFVPAMGCFALFFVRLIKKDATIQIPTLTVFFQVALISLYFEFYLPTYRSHVHPYTGDWTDVLMYFLGGVLFVFLQRRI
jgi:glycopeptide antibiotics resistance protein